jgi:hypothetical protein
VSTLFDQVPVAIDRVRREIVLARFIGKLAVDQGIRELRARLEEASGTRAGSAPDPTPDEAPPLEDAGPPDPHEGGDDIDVTLLALADYDHLPASDVVSKLAGLEPDERGAIEAYELNGRRRRTILGKIEQLKSEAP